MAEDEQKPRPGSLAADMAGLRRTQEVLRQAKLKRLAESRAMNPEEVEKFVKKHSK